MNHSLQINIGKSIIILFVIAFCLPLLSFADRPVPHLYQIYPRPVEDGDVFEVVVPTQRDQSEFVEGLNDFAFDMLWRINQVAGDQEKPTLFFSPYSIDTAMLMAYTGARGETAEQMRTVLNYELDSNTLHATLNQLKNRIESYEEIQLNIANGLWVQEDLPLVPSFLQVFQTYYNDNFQRVNFPINYETIRQDVNTWVADQTEQRILNLIPSGVLSAEVLAVLVNAIYYNADWLIPFNTENTHDIPFNLLDGATVQVPTMFLDRDLMHFRGPNYQALSLNYAGEKTSMLIILPDAGKFEDVERFFNLRMFNHILINLSEQEVNLFLPKFEFTTTFPNLAAIFYDMGMIKPFSNSAEFYGMLDRRVMNQQEDRRKVKIDRVIHKAFIKVNEEGTEAAAATAVIMRLTSASIGDSGPIVFRVDRPFFFVIRDNHTNTILFLGRVMNPLDTASEIL